MSYTVVSGDTYWSISQKLHISIEALEASNPGVNQNSLQIGQTLKVPSNGVIDVFKYIIKSGDTLFSIGQSHGSSVEAIESVNPKVNVNALKVGQIVNVPITGNGYVEYAGPASNFPNVLDWASWDKLWTDNLRLMKLHDSDPEIALIKKSIQQVAAESGVDPRVILCIIVQESGGNVRVNSVSGVMTNSPMGN